MRQRLEQRLNLAQPAALVRRGSIQQAVLGLLLGDRIFGQQIDQIESPFARNAVAIGIGFGKVIAGVEKEDGYPCIQLERQLRQQYIFSLKAAREAHIRLACNRACKDRAQIV